MIRPQLSHQLRRVLISAQNTCTNSVVARENYKLDNGVLYTNGNMVVTHDPGPGSRDLHKVACDDHPRCEHRERASATCDTYNPPTETCFIPVPR